MGGLPVIAEVWFTRGDGWMTDDDAGVDALYWIKRDGTKGKRLSDALMEKIARKDPWWEVDVTEAVSEQLAHEAWQAKEDARNG